MNLKSKHSFGADGISSYLLKQVSDLVSSPLSHIINHSFQFGIFPESLKHSIVRPLHKKGSKEECGNYRAISLVSTFSKVFERVFLNRLVDFVSKNNIMSRCQFGFSKGKSTSDAIYFLISSIVEALDRGESAVGVFFDLTRAFDMVHHGILLQKLNAMGLRGTSLSWIASYLTGREQTVQVPFIDSNGYERVAYSEACPLLRGVPQGSVLGPILFLLFVNDLSHVTSSAQVCQFADDTSVSVTSLNRSDLEVRVYEVSNSLLQWFQNNNLYLNNSKTQILDFHISDRKQSEPLTFFIDCEQVMPSVVTKFLGVYIDDGLKFEHHIESVSKRISSGIFLLRRLSTFVDDKILLPAYYGLIYPILSYSVVIWGHESSKTHFLFKLQKKAIRAVFRKPYRYSCKPIFKQHNILTFPSIYIFQCVMFVRKHPELFTSVISSNRYELRGRLNISIPRHKTSFFESHLKLNATKLYNSLPETVKTEKDVNKFGRVVKGLLLSRCCYSVREFLESK